MHRGFSPSFSHALVAWTAFWLQPPATDMRLIYSSNLSFNRGSSRKRWSVSRILGVALHTCKSYIKTSLKSATRWCLGYGRTSRNDTHLALGILQFGWVQQFTTFLTLITPRRLVVAARRGTGPFNQPVSQEFWAVITIKLCFGSCSVNYNNDGRTQRTIKMKSSNDLGEGGWPAAWCSPRASCSLRVSGRWPGRPPSAEGSKCGQTHQSLCQTTRILPCELHGIWLQNTIQKDVKGKKKHPIMPSCDSLSVYQMCTESCSDIGIVLSLWKQIYRSSTTLPWRGHEFSWNIQE